MHVTGRALDSHPKAYMLSKAIDSNMVRHVDFTIHDDCFGPLGLMLPV